MEKCRRMKRPQCMSKRWTYSWLWKSSKTRQQYCRLESFAMKTDIPMNGSTVKNHISLKTGFGYNAIRRTSFQSWFQACQRVLPPVLILQLQWHLQDRRGIVLHHPRARLLHQLQQHQVTVRLEKQRIKLKLIHLQCLCQVQMLMIERWNPLFADSGRASSEIPEWLQEFRENMVDDGVPEHGDSHASSSHEASLEPTFKRCEDLCKHSVYTLPWRPKLRDLSEDQNYKGPVQKTQWRSRTSCWKCWWLDNSRSQSSQWRLWISQQSSICNRGAGLGHPMDPVTSVQNKNFTGNTEKLAKVLGARWEA